jgi:hypothetical protein
MLFSATDFKTFFTSIGGKRSHSTLSKCGYGFKNTIHTVKFFYSLSNKNLTQTISIKKSPEKHLDQYNGKFRQALNIKPIHLALKSK